MKDWDKELAKIDRHIQALPEETSAPPAAPVGPAAGGPREAMPPSGIAVPPRMRFGAYLRLGLAALVGVGIMFWPYTARCGLGLMAYLLAVLVVTVAGVWSAVWTWRHRTAKAHVVSLLIVMWGLVLGSLQVLPRVGYAKATLARPAVWSCQ